MYPEGAHYCLFNHVVNSLTCGLGNTVSLVAFYKQLGDVGKWGVDGVRTGGWEEQKRRREEERKRIER